MSAQNAPHILSIPPHAFAESGLLSSVTNTVLSTWIFVVIVAICATILFLARKRKSGFIHTTGFLIVKHMKAFFEPLLGHNLPLNKSLWFVGGVFIYIFGANLYSLFLDWILAFLPGLHNYLRPINADINTTLGLAVVMIFLSHLIMIRFKGFFGYVGHFAFHFHGKTFVEKCISVVVGWLHGVGELVRVLALSLRLFGNIFAGVVLIGVMIWLSGLISVGFLPVGNLMVIPFYFLEMFV